MATKFLASNMALAPLFVCVGAGVVLSCGFGAHYLANSPDVSIRKNSAPWNKISQADNTKLFSYNKDWWSSRANIPHPQSAFLQDGASPSSIERVKAARKAAKVSKEDAIAH